MMVDTEDVEKWIKVWVERENFHVRVSLYNLADQIQKLQTDNEVMNFNQYIEDKRNYYGGNLLTGERVIVISRNDENSITMHLVTIDKDGVRRVYDNCTLTASGKDI